MYQHSIMPLALPCKLVIPDRGKSQDQKGMYPPQQPAGMGWISKQGAAVTVPCLLDPMEEKKDNTSATNSATDLLKQGAGE